MRKQKSIKLYCLPAELTTGETTSSQEFVKIPGGSLPGYITRRSDADAVIAQLLDWFKANLVEQDGYLVASAALPSLSVNRDAWNEAIEWLKPVLQGYNKVTGPVFVPSFSLTRTSKFQIADHNLALLRGSQMEVVTYTVPVEKEESLYVPAPMPEPGEETPAVEE